jgi:hypothetical protein
VLARRGQQVPGEVHDVREPRIGDRLDRADLGAACEDEHGRGREEPEHEGC